MSLGKQLEILIIEDDPVEASRLVRELARHGAHFRSRRVRRKEEFLLALGELKPDLILSDCSLSAFDGFAALDLAQERCPEVPFIFVSRNRDHRTMVEIFQSGAAGCVYRQRLDDLGPVLRRVLPQSCPEECSGPDNA